MRVARFAAPPQVPTEQRSITTVDAPFINPLDPQAAMRPPWFASALMPLPPQPAPERTSTLTKPDTDANVRAVAAPAFRSATPIHAPQPLIPQGLSFPQYAYDHAVEVKVEVSINVAGRVTNTRLVEAAGPYASQLGPYAMNAARAWTFHPATLGGQPIASSMVLTFRYTRPQ
jgi:TonB family protein